MVRELSPWRLQLRLFFGQLVLGHRARPRRWILRPEPLPGDGLRVGRKLEYSQVAEALPAQLLGRVLIKTRRSDVRFRGNAQLQPFHRGLLIGETSIRRAERISAGRLPYTWAGELDGIRIGAFREQGHHNDFDIEQERPIIYVI